MITRKDLSPGYQAVQSCHAAIQFTHEHPEIEAVWYVNSNYLALLSVENELGLIELIKRADELSIPVSFFEEPDIGNQITAIALGPGQKTKKLCSSFDPALK